MNGTKLDVRTADGVADCYLYRPAGAGPWPGVLFFQDGIGVRPRLHQMAEHLSQQGYAVLMPNMFYRAGSYPPFNAMTVFSDPVERDRLSTLIRSVGGIDRAMPDTATFLDALAQQPGVKADKVGCVGYCMGGRLALLAAGTFPDRIAAGASIHPGGLVSDQPDSPHLLAPKIKAQLYFGIADNDRSCTPEQQAQLKAALDAAKVRYQLEVYTGAQHGFSMADTPVYDKAAEDKHWERVLALFREALPRAA